LSRGSPAVLTDVSQCLFAVSTAQSMSFWQSTQRLLGKSQMLVPVGFVVQLAVPQGRLQVLFVPHVAPAGHCVLSMH
jgi:hypothetical protein